MAVGNPNKVKKLERSKLLYIVDLGLAISFFSLFITGLIKFPRLIQFFGIMQQALPIYEINIIHDWSGIIMGILVLVHLALHWRFLVAWTKRAVGRK